MVVLDMTVMNLALPSAQHALGFSNVDRQWIVTAYSLSFGSLLLFSGRVADLIGRKVIFITGLIGFAVASAVGGASVSFAMLVTARACQGVFGAMLAPAALALLTTTFSDPKERGKAFGVYGAIAGARRRGRPAARRRADRVPVVALVPLHQPVLRRARGGRRLRAAEAAAAAERARGWTCRA